MIMRFDTPVRSFLLSGLLVAGFSIVVAILLGWQDYRVADLPFQLKNKDFANYWMAGQLAVEGNAMRLFGPPAAYFDEMKAVFGADYPWHNWSYPPHAALPLVPLGLMQFLPAMALFLGLTLSLYLFSLATIETKWSFMALLLLIPFIVANLVSTQNGFLTAALMIAALALRARNPLLAGILLGVLTCKPQLGFLLPILLIAEGRWRVIAAAAVTTAALLSISVVAFGTESWIGYVTLVAPYQTEIMNTLGGDFPFMMGSAFGSVRSFGLTADTALVLHLPFAIAGAALFALSLWKLTDLHARAFATLLATFLITPYSVAYDFGAVAAFAALWPMAAGDRDPPLHLRVLMLLIAVLPIAMLPLGKAGLPLTPVVLLAALGALLANEGAFRRTSRSSLATP